MLLSASADVFRFHTYQSTRSKQVRSSRFPASSLRSGKGFVIGSLLTSEIRPAASRQQQRQPLPALTFSASKKDVRSEELAALLQSARDDAVHKGSSQLELSFLHWSLPADPERLHERLQQAVDNSTAIIGAYAEATDVPNWANKFSHEKDTGNRSPLGWLTRKQRKVLVGFARAAGDRTLVSTLHDLVVHPELQGQGIGRRLLQLLVQQVHNQDIGDIGAMVPAGKQGFFAACSFAPDREESLPMTFVGRDGAGPPGELQPLRDEASMIAELQSNRSLRRLMETAIKDPGYFRGNFGFRWPS